MLPPNSDLLNGCYADRARKQASRSISCGFLALMAIILDAILSTVFIFLNYGSSFLFLLFYALAIAAFILIALSMIFAVSAKYYKFKMRKEVNLKTHENWAFIPSLIVIAAIGTISCINLLSFLDARKERLTARNLRVKAAILEIYYFENRHYPFPGFIGNADEIKNKLKDYRENFKAIDGWGRTMIYACTKSGENYFMIAPCKDGALDEQSQFIIKCIRKGQDEIDNFRGGIYGNDFFDIVLSGGYMMVHPGTSSDATLFGQNTDLYAVAEEKER